MRECWEEGEQSNQPDAEESGHTENEVTSHKPHGSV